MWSNIKAKVEIGLCRHRFNQDGTAYVAKEIQCAKVIINQMSVDGRAISEYNKMIINSNR